MEGIVQVYKIVLNKFNFHEDKNVWLSFREKVQTCFCFVLFCFFCRRAKSFRSLRKMQTKLIYRLVMSKQTIQVVHLWWVSFIKTLKKFLFWKRKDLNCILLDFNGKLFYSEKKKKKKTKTKWWHHDVVSQIHIRSWHGNSLKVTSYEKLYFATLIFYLEKNISFPNI